MARPASNYDDNNRIHIKRQWCKGCGICTALCDNKVLLIDNRGKAVVAIPAACTACGKCESHCPDLAISVDSPFKTKVAGFMKTKFSGHGDTARA